MRSAAASTFEVMTELRTMDAVMPVANAVGMKASSGHPRVGQEHRGGPVLSHSYIESVIHLEIICQF